MLYWWTRKGGNLSQMCHAKHLVSNGKFLELSSHGFGGLPRCRHRLRRTRGLLNPIRTVMTVRSASMIRDNSPPGDPVQRRGSSGLAEFEVPLDRSPGRVPVTSDQWTSNLVLGMARDFNSRTTRSSSVFDAVCLLRRSASAALRYSSKSPVIFASSSSFRDSVRPMLSISACTLFKWLNRSGPYFRCNRSSSASRDWRRSSSPGSASIRAE